MSVSVGTWLSRFSPHCVRINGGCGPGSAQPGGQETPRQRMLENLLPRRKLHLRQPRPWGGSPSSALGGCRLGAVGEEQETRKGHVPLARMGRGPREERSFLKKGTSPSCLSLYPTPWLSNLGLPISFLFPSWLLCEPC